MRRRTRAPATVPAGVEERTLCPIWMEELCAAQAEQAQHAGKEDAARVSPVSLHDSYVSLWLL